MFPNIFICRISEGHHDSSGEQKLQRIGFTNFSRQRYTAADLRKIFHVEMHNDTDLFSNFTPSGNEYPALQADVTKMAARFRLSKSDNEATRGSLLVSRILWASGERYHLGVFFEPLVNLHSEDTPKLPHQLNGAYDGAVSLDEIDFVSPIIAVVEVKRSNLSEGLVFFQG